MRRHGIITEDWKLSLIVPIFKPKKIELNDINSNTDIFRRIFEKSIFKSFIALLLPRSRHQYAYTAHHSIFDAIALLEHQIKDFESAFDKLDRSFVLKYLCKYMNENSIRLIHHLMDNKLVLRYHSKKSNTTNGTIQGGCLAPIIFIFALQKCFEAKDVPAAMREWLLMIADDLTKLEKPDINFGNLMDQVNKALEPANLSLSNSKTLILADDKIKLINKPNDIPRSANAEKLLGHWIGYHGLDHNKMFEMLKTKFCMKLLDMARIGYFFKGLTIMSKFMMYFTQIQSLLEWISGYLVNSKIADQTEKLICKSLRIYMNTTKTTTPQHLIFLYFGMRSITSQMAIPSKQQIGESAISGAKVFHAHPIVHVQANITD